MIALLHSEKGLLYHPLAWKFKDIIKCVGHYGIINIRDCYKVVIDGFNATWKIVGQPSGKKFPLTEKEFSILDNWILDNCGSMEALQYMIVDIIYHMNVPRSGPSIAQEEFLCCLFSSLMKDAVCKSDDSSSLFVYPYNISSALISAIEENFRSPWVKLWRTGKVVRPLPIEIENTYDYKNIPTDVRIGGYNINISEEYGLQLELSGAAIE